ncbi:MAG: hypothetical protein U5K29_07455 [Acidimicrobiales bacterium]|nr:hypothetical protein [Acidimicrobiales bacterium]
MSTPRRLPVLVAIVAAAGILAAACGDDGTTPVSTGSADPDVAILELGHEGGFTTPEVHYTQMPQLVVYADGRVVTSGAQAMVYPAPALPPLFESQLTDDGLVTLRSAIADAGLDIHGVDYGQPPVADAGQTVVQVRVDGETYEHRAEALGMAGPAGGLGGPAEGPDEGGDGPDELGLTAEQRDARDRLQAFVDGVTNLGGLVGPEELGEETPVDIERFRLWVRPADELDQPMDAPEDEPAPDEVEWTVDGVDLEASECLVVEGDVASRLAELLADADQLTRFTEGDQVFSVVARPVLAHEDTCPPA